MSNTNIADLTNVSQSNFYNAKKKAFNNFVKICDITET